MEESRAATTEMDRNRRIVQSAIYLYFRREINGIPVFGKLNHLICARPLKKLIRDLIYWSQTLAIGYRNAGLRRG